MPVGYQHSEQGPVAANYAKMLSAAQRSRRSGLVLASSPLQQARGYWPVMSGIS